MEDHQQDTGDYRSLLQQNYSNISSPAHPHNKIKKSVNNIHSLATMTENKRQVFSTASFSVKK